MESIAKWQNSIELIETTETRLYICNAIETPSNLKITHVECTRAFIQVDLLWSHRFTSLG